MHKKLEQLVEDGVIFRDVSKVDIRGNIECGTNINIDINVIFEGNVTLGDNVVIGSNCIITDSNIGDNVQVKPFSMIEGAVIGKDSFIGPFARVRQGCEIGVSVQLGNFIEIKNAQIGDGCRINHMTFLGDAELADNVTIGAGSITCNYDGKRTHKTIIESDTFIGSGTNLIAPLTVGQGSTIGSGSTITEDVPREKLTIARNKQVTIEGWNGPKHNLKDEKS